MGRVCVPGLTGSPRMHVPDLDAAVKEGAVQLVRAPPEGQAPQTDGHTNTGGVLRGIGQDGAAWPHRRHGPCL